jgi:DNA segregation ATPase FtsK/SpoIIIE, S-DNA-T family
MQEVTGYVRKPREQERFGQGPAPVQRPMPLAQAFGRFGRMFDNRNLRVDLVAIVLAAVTTFLAAALLTRDPADPVGEYIGPVAIVYQPDVLVSPQHERIHNACGRWGALAADVLLTSVGVGAYYVVGSLALLSIALVRQYDFDRPIQRAIGWAMSLLGISTLTATLAPGLPVGPVIGSGGYLGKLGHVMLETHFATAGGLILATCVTIAGWMLSTDYTLLKLLVKIASLGTVRLDALRSRRQAEEEYVEEKVSTSSRKRRDDLPPPPKMNPAEPYALRINGKHMAQEIDEEEYDHDEEADSALDQDLSNDLSDEAEEEFDDDAPFADPPAADGALAPSLPIAAVPAIAAKVAEDAVAKVKNSKDRKQAVEQVREAVKTELDKATTIEGEAEYELPSLDLLQPGEDIDFEEQAKEVRRKAKLIEKTFLDFGFKVRVVEIETGPVIAQYEVELEPGLRLSKITSLADDLAIALRVPSVRIVAPIPGKNSVGIEVPNEARQTVRMREVIEEANGKVKKMRIPLFLGKDVSGNPLLADLSALPHLLIAGSTGTGKSVCLNAIIASILMTRRPDEVRMLMIDPKLVELSGYGRLPHLMHPVVTDMRKAEAILNWGVEKMEERYALLARAGVRHISGYNQLDEDELMERLQPEDEEQKQAIPLNLPYIVIVVDEFADLMMQCGKEVEQHIIRLAQKSRAVGIHLILATQKPTVDVITGLIKSNLPARVCFKVTNRTDSRVVLDEMGAEKLLGMGDMLFLAPGTSQLLRGQGTYLGDDEINTVVDFVSTSEQNFVTELVTLKPKDESGEMASLEQLKKRDPLYESAVEIVVSEGRGSVSLLQRSLGIGYGRAARLIDFMAEDGIVGHYAGSQAREILISLDDWERMKGGSAEVQDNGPSNAVPPPRSAKARTAPAVFTEAKPRKRLNKVLPEPWDDEPADDADGYLADDADLQSSADDPPARDSTLVDADDEEPSDDDFSDDASDEESDDYADEQRESA